MFAICPASFWRTDGLGKRDVDIPRSLVDVALHVPTLLHKHGPGVPDDFSRIGRGDLPQSRDDSGALLCPGGRDRLLEGMQNFGEGLVRQAGINAVDGPERWGQRRLIQQAREDAFLQCERRVPFQFDEVRGRGGM